MKNEKNRVSVIEKPCTSERLCLSQRLHSESDVIARLLERCQMISATDLADAQKRARSLELGVDQVLLRCFYMPRSLHIEVCRAASYVERGLLSFESAATGLSISVEFSQPLEGVLARQAQSSPKTKVA